jgi:hypothetical protein
MTGLWVRIERQGQWHTVELEELTPQEWRAYAAAQAPARGWVVAELLAAWIRTHVRDAGAGQYRRRQGAPRGA